MTQIIAPDYKGHEVFKNLAEYAQFYDSLSMSILQQPTMGTRAFGNIDTYVFSSLQGTLKSMAYLLENGRINDAFALLRRLYDVATINVYTNLWIQHHCKPESYVVPLVNDWLHGKLKEGLPGLEKMVPYIQNSPELGALFKLIKSDGRYKEIRKRCNDHMHYNFFDTFLLNDGEVYRKDRLAWLDKFNTDLQCILIYHLTLIFGLKETYMMSSDWLDYMELERSPPDDSQYCVSSFVQDMLNNLVQKERPDLYVALKDGAAMHLA